MSETPDIPEPTDSVSDAVAGNWVDRFAPAATRPYLRLSRADRPIGTWLLFIPCLWGLLIAMLETGRMGLGDLWIAVACGIGAFVMRGAGCTWNDITDRDIDAQVARTRSRPIPSGQVSVRGAAIWMVVQALIGLAILLSLSDMAIVLGFAAIIPVAIYPFAKRFTWWPQMFLGIAFNWGALLAYAAHADNLGWAAGFAYATGIVWTLFYDTIYAHQDKEDDALVGVKSTARLFGDKTALALRLFLVGTVVLGATSVILATVEQANILVLVVALGGPWAMGWHLAWQMRRLDIDDPENCMQVFRSNRDAGLIPVLFSAVALFM